MGVSNPSQSILIVDDNAEIVEALSLILEEVGYTVRTLHDEETFETIQEIMPGLLLLDIWMAGQDGRDICRSLKSQPATWDLPIILISANNDITRIAKEVGADDYLIKPFRMKEVLAKVEKYVALP